MSAMTKRKNFAAEAMPHFEALRRMARRLTTNFTDAEDLVQETFMQAWKSFDKYTLETNCRAWLFRILLNKHNHFQRHRFIQTTFFQSVDYLFFDNIATEKDSPQHLTNRKLIRILKRLPANYRDCVFLVDVHEFTYKEVAGKLNIPIGTVMSRLSRGRQILREILGNEIAEVPEKKFAQLLEIYV